MLQIKLYTHSFAAVTKTLVNSYYIVDVEMHHFIHIYLIIKVL